MKAETVSISLGTTHLLHSIVTVRGIDRSVMSKLFADPMDCM